MIYLKQSTASQEVPLGHFVDDSDGKTAETGLTISNTDIKIWKTGATSLADKNSGGATHMAGGVYYAVLDATDTNTLGPLTIFVHESGALPVKVDCCVLAANVYDSLIGNSDKLKADVSGIPTATENADALLNRDMSAVSDTNARSPLNALRHIRNKWAISSSTLTVYKEDDTTSAWTSSMSTATADPITGSDPA
jgi:hypothetical protein